MKAKSVRDAALVVLAMVMACGCGEKESPSPVEEGPPPVKLSMLFSSKSGNYRGAERWADLVERKSGGKIRLEIHAGGRLLKGGAGGQLALLKSGAADIALIPPAMLTHVSPSLEVLYLPFLFPNRRSAEAVLDGEVGQTLLEGLDKGEIVGLGYYSGPFLQLSSSRRVVAPEEMAGLRVRLPKGGGGRDSAGAMKLLGAEAVDLPIDKLRGAFDRGSIDGQISTLELYHRLHLDAWQKHVTMINYSFEPMVVCASSAFWKGLGTEEQGMLLSALREAAQYHRELLARQELEARNKLFEGGISVIELIPEELELFKRMVRGRYADMLPGVDEAIVSEMEEEAERNSEPYMYRFYDNLGSAFVDTPRYSAEAYPKEKLPVSAEGSVLARIGDAYDFDERYGIFCPVPSRLEYKVVVPPNAKLEFGIGVRPGTYQQFPYGVTFTVDVRDERAGTSRRIYERMLNPLVNKDERKWFDELLDINLPAGERVTIVFSAERAWQEEKPAELYYGAVWTNPVLSEEDMDTYHRNIILISVDTLRADALGCYGNMHDASPNIDRMAEGGTMFANCISQETWTLPSHMSMMTSLYPSQHNMHHRYWNYANQLKLSPGFLTLAEALRDKGYNTVAFAESGYVDSIFGFNQGFNSYSNFWFFYDEDKKERGSIRDKSIDMVPLVFRDKVDLDKPLSDVMRTTHITFSCAIEWLKNRGSRKFFCFIHTYEPHIPYFTNPYVRQFNPRYSGVIPDTLPAEWLSKFIKRVSSGHYQLTEEDCRHLWALYSAQVKFTDDFIGQLLVTLKKQGLEHNTLVVFTSDHGERLYSHGYCVEHMGSPHEAVIKVPLITRCDSIALPGEKISPQVALLDIFPTILDFAGSRKPSVLKGMSLYPAIVRGTPLAEARPVFSENNLNSQKYEGKHAKDWRIGVRFDDKKFIYYPTSGYRELFDLSSDPGEVDNLADESEETEMFEGMVKKYIRSNLHGFYLVLTSDGSEHTFKGEVTIEGVFQGIHSENIEWKWVPESKDDPSVPPVSFLKFEAKVSGPGVHVLRFDAHPEDARITLDLQVDGVQDPTMVFLGGATRHPESLPCVIDDSILDARNPYAFTASKRVGCYLSRVDTPFFVDRSPRGGLRVAKTVEPSLEVAVEGEKGGITVPDKEERERAQRLMGRLQDIGQVQEEEVQVKKDEKEMTVPDEESTERANRVRERLKALGYVE